MFIVELKNGFKITVDMVQESFRVFENMLEQILILHSNSSESISMDEWSEQLTADNLDSVNVYNEDKKKIEEYKGYSKLIGANKTLRKDGYFYEIQLAKQAASLMFSLDESNVK